MGPSGELYRKCIKYIIVNGSSKNGTLSIVDSKISKVLPKIYECTTMLAI